MSDIGKPRKSPSSALTKRLIDRQRASLNKKKGVVGPDIKGNSKAGQKDLRPFSQRIPKQMPMPKSQETFKSIPKWRSGPGPADQKSYPAGPSIGSDIKLAEGGAKDKKETFKTFLKSLLKDKMKTGKKVVGAKDDPASYSKNPFRRQ